MIMMIKDQECDIVNDEKNDDFLLIFTTVQLLLAIVEMKTILESRI